MGAYSAGDICILTEFQVPSIIDLAEWPTLAQNLVDIKNPTNVLD